MAIRYRSELIDFRGSVRYSASEHAPPVSDRHASPFTHEMKAQIAIAWILACAPEFTMGWVKPDPINYEKQFRDADLVAIVRIEAVKLSEGFENLDSYPKVQFKRIRASFQIETILKGVVPETKECELVREATLEELKAEYSYGDYRKLALVSMANELVWHYVSDPQVGKFYMCFLTKSDKGILLPTTGLAKSSYSFIEVKPPARAQPKKGGGEQHEPLKP